MHPLQVQITRGEQVESTHIVDAIVVDSAGTLIESFGDTDQLIYPRSMIKPVQALVFVMAEGHKALSEPEKAIALACASHSAEADHLHVVSRWLKELDLHEADLVCGPQEPEDKAMRDQLIRTHEEPRKIHNNCSGKHAGLMAACLKRGWPVHGYAEWDHPLQKELRHLLTQLSGFDHEKAPWGVDGCGIPTYALPLSAVAKMMTAFLRPDDFASEIRNALLVVKDACAHEPWMISGHESLCSEVNAATGGKIFAKVGAEGNYAALSYVDGKSIVLKARDGAFRACEAALYHLLEKHCSSSSADLVRVKKYAAPELRNRSGDLVGEILVREPQAEALS